MPPELASALLCAALLLPLLPGVLLCPLVGRANTAGRRRATAWLAGVCALMSMGSLVLLAPAVFGGDIPVWHWPWLPEAGLALALRLDGLSLLFALLVTAIGALIVLYAAYYMDPGKPVGRFYALLLFFMAAMLGIVLADNLLMLLVAWELTSLSSFLLVGYEGRRADARAGARAALAVTGAGGLALLAALLLLGQAGGTFSLSELLSRGEQVRAHANYPLILALLLLGCFTKSAQLPFHFWLPEAMAAPTPVSAYLHSATMVKAGIYLLARLYPVLGNTDTFQFWVSGTGLATLVFGAYVAVFKHDIKALLAYSTISHLGLLVFLLGLSSPLSKVAAVLHVINHATFKASLFMTAGIIDHESGTRDMRRLGGLFRLMPWTGTLAMVAAASMAGVPLVNGFLSKEMFFDQAVEAGGPWTDVSPYVALVFGVCSVAYSLRFIHDVFFNGPPRRLPHTPHEPPAFMRMPVSLLVLVCLLIGMLPAATVGPLVGIAAAAVLQARLPDYELALWHGLTLPVAMSAVAILGGIAMYFALLHRLPLHLHRPGRFTARRLFAGALQGLQSASAWLGARTDNGSLQRSLALLLACAVLAGGWPLVGVSLAPAGTGAAHEGAPVTALALVLWALLVAAGAGLLIAHRKRLLAIVLAGVIGLVTAISFEVLSAPDLALTQLGVEVVSTVLLLMGLSYLPATTPRESSRLRLLRDAVLALAAGLGMAALCWLVLTRGHATLSWYFVEHALAAAGGANVVNVILVDFRGFDTLGEITVLTIAGLGALRALQSIRLRRQPGEDLPQAWLGRPSLLLRMAGRLVLPLALTLAVYLFWRGHQLPGGGFIAALVTAAAGVLQAIALGQEAAEAPLGAWPARRYTHWAAAGLGLAAAVGAGAMLARAPFLTSAHWHGTLPLLGEASLSTATLFDAGVYLAVLGAILLLFHTLGPAHKEDTA